MTDRKPLYDTIRTLKRRWMKKPGIGLSQAEVREIEAALGTVETPTTTPTSTAGKLTLGGIVGAVAASSLFLTIPEDEGTRYRAYRDIAGIWTICQGDTNNVQPGLTESEEGCRRRLEAQLIAHAKPVMACTPRLAEEGRDRERAAAVSLAYNIGVRAYCRSTVDRRFDAGDWKGGCEAILKWNKARVGGRLREVSGLTNRRQRERDLCLGVRSLR